MAKPSEKDDHRFFVVYFPETEELETIPRDSSNDKATLGSRLRIKYPDRAEPYEGIVKALCKTESEGESICDKLMVRFFNMKLFIFGNATLKT